MFPGDEQHIAEAFRRKMTGLGSHLLDLKRHAEDGIVTGESAVGTVIDALIGKVEGGEEAHRPAKVTPCQCSGAPGHLLKGDISARFQ